MARYQDPYGAPTAPSGGVDLTPQAPRTMQPPSNPYGSVPQAPARYPTLPQVPYGQPGYRTPTFPGFQPTSEFANDPTTANYERLMNYQIPYFMQPVQQQNYLGQTAGQYSNLLDAINRVQGLAFGGPSPGEAMLLSLAGSLAGGGNADAYAHEYRSYLNQEPFTGAEREAYQTEFMDPLQAQEDQAVAMATREIANQGIDLNSGIAQAKLNEVRRTFQQAKAQAQNQFAISANQMRAQRKGQAFEAGLSAEQLKNQARSAAMSGASGAAGAWANRLGMGLDAAGLGNSAALQRAAMGYDVDQALRNKQYQNFVTAMNLAQIMANLPSQRMAEAVQFMNGADPSSVVGMYGNLASQRQGQAGFNQGIWNNMASGLGSLASYYAQPTVEPPVYDDLG
jgi:hypothetical protein